jgi:hypothetical protein
MYRTLAGRSDSAIDRDGRRSGVALYGLQQTSPRHLPEQAVIGRDPAILSAEGSRFLAARKLNPKPRRSRRAPRRGFGPISGMTRF